MSTRVLVVDDTILFRRAVSEALSGIAGVEVAGSAANGRLALQKLAALRPDLMTLDIEMPEMNGLEVLEAMKTEGSGTGVIVLSSLTMRGGAMTVRALELGAFDFVTKPDGGSPADNILLLRRTSIQDVPALSSAPIVRGAADLPQARRAIASPIVPSRRSLPAWATTEHWG